MIYSHIVLHTPIHSKYRQVEITLKFSYAYYRNVGTHAKQSFTAILNIISRIKKFRLYTFSVV